MPWINRILVPVDLSPCSLAALHYAIFLGEHSGAQLHILNVVDATSIEQPDENRRQLEAWLAAAPSLVAQTAQIHMGTGPVVEAIVCLASEQHVDLIVMGKYGDTAAQSAQTGNVTAGVAARATCGVVPVHQAAAGSASFALAAAANDTALDFATAIKGRVVPIRSGKRRPEGSEPRARRGKPSGDPVPRLPH